MQSEIQNLVTTLVAVFVPFLPVLFGAVEFIKKKTGLKGRAVEALSAVIFCFIWPGGAVGLFLPCLGLVRGGWPDIFGHVRPGSVWLLQIHQCSSAGKRWERMKRSSMIRARLSGKSWKNG